MLTSKTHEYKSAVLLSCRPNPIFEGQRRTSDRGKKTICQSDAAISNATVNARIRYGNSAHAAASHCLFKTAANCGIADRNMITIDSLLKLV